MELITDIAIYVFTSAFCTGFLITAITGSARVIKILLLTLSLLFLLGIVAGFIFSQGLLVFLVTQLIVLILILYSVIIAGAAAGGGIYSLVHKKKSKLLAPDVIHEYMQVGKFCEKERITEQRALSRIKSGYYLGGLYEGNWYVHQSELTENSV